MGECLVVGHFGLLNLVIFLFLRFSIVLPLFNEIKINRTLYVLIYR